METPGTFDLWVIIKKEYIKEGVALLTTLQPKLSKLEIHKQINYSIHGNFILIAKSLPLRKIEDINNHNFKLFDNTILCQEGYTPEEHSKGKYQYCKTHNYIHGGCRGCHICRGFYMA